MQVPLRSCFFSLSLSLHAEHTCQRSTSWSTDNSLTRPQRKATPLCTDTYLQELSCGLFLHKIKTYNKLNDFRSWSGPKPTSYIYTGFKLFLYLRTAHRHLLILQEPNSTLGEYFTGNKWYIERAPLAEKEVWGLFTKKEQIFQVNMYSTFRALPFSVPGNTLILQKSNIHKKGSKRKRHLYRK